MGKDKVKRISVWEKVADFLMDIAKYVLTAVIITSAIEDIGDNEWIKYGISIAGSGLLLLWGILLHYYKKPINMIMTAIGIGMCVIGTIGIIYTIANKDKFATRDEE